MANRQRDVDLRFMCKSLPSVNTLAWLGLGSWLGDVVVVVVVVVMMLWI